MLGYLISPVLQVENTDGKPLVGGRIVVYRHGTTEPYITYKDFEGTHNPAEVILDSKGMCILIAEEGYSYDVYCRDRNYVEQWSRIGISIGLGGTSIISRDGTITVKSAGGVVDLGISDNDVTVLTGTGAERGTDGNFSISKTASSGEGLEVTGNRVKVKKAGWYHIEATWYAQSNTTANGYRTVELSTRDSRTKLTLDLTVSSEQWRIIANDFYLHADEYIDFTLSGMGSDSAVRSWLQNVSIHRLTNIVGNPPDRVRPDWAEQDPDSPAYIFNKPNLAPVATTGSYESLTDKPDLDIYATKVENATEGNLAALDADGNLVDSGEASENLVHDANYVHTDNNYTTEDKEKLAGIAAGAEVNVQADWTEDDSTKDSYIQNKPHVPTVSGDGTSISSIDGLPIYAASATRATQDGVGNNIVDTYGTKADVSAKQDKLTSANAGINISISNEGKIDVKNQNCSAIDSTAVAIGYMNLAYGAWTFAHGCQTSAIDLYSHTEGYANYAKNGSHAEGQNTVSNGYASHTEGNYTSAIKPASHAEGNYTVTDTEYQHVEGQYNAPAVGALHVIGNGTGADNRSNIVETYTDRVVVNGDLINDTKDTALAQFMFDNTPLSSNAQTKLVLKNGPINVTTPISAAKIYNIGNYEYINNPSGVTDQQYLINVSGVEIVDWEGTVGAVLHGNIGDFRVPIAWPTDNLPANCYNGSYALSYNSFAADNKRITSLPSGWLNSVSAYVTHPGETGHYLYNVREMFRGCTNLTGDVKPWMDFVLAQSGAGRPGAPGREWYKAGMFRGCTLVDDYEALRTSETYSAFFA